MSGQILWKFDGDHDLQGYTVIIPSVAVGNVGQLSCDLLISSLKMTKIASIYTPALIPILGYDPYHQKSSDLCGSCDIFKSDNEKIVAVQIRAPLIYRYAKEFLESLVSHFQSKKVGDVVILASSHAHEKKNIMSSPFRFVGDSIYKSNLNSLNLIEHEFLNNELKIYGGGFACHLYKICKEKAVPCLILFKYCSEGDNIPDAYDMVFIFNKLRTVFSLEKELEAQLIQPESWQLLFGRPPPVDIY